MHTTLQKQPIIYNANTEQSTSLHLRALKS